MKLTRRFLALLLAFSMSLSMVTPAFASETDAEPVVEATEAAVIETEAVEATTEAATEEPETEEVVLIVEEVEASEEAANEEGEEEEPAGGSYENPLYPNWEMNDEQTEATVVITVAAGETIYFSVPFAGMNLYINDVDKGMIGGSRWAPEVRSITNDGEEAEDYFLKAVVPVETAVGTMENPDELVIGNNTATASEVGYFYNWIATAEGNLTITITEGESWNYVINNNSSYAYGDIHASDDEPVVESDSVYVYAGDLIEIVVGTDSEVSFTAEFAKVGTSADLPIFIAGDAMALDLEAGETLYFAGRVGGKDLVIENAEGLVLTMNGEEYTADESGVISFLVPGDAGFFAPPVSFTVTNGNAAAVSTTMKFMMPEGSSENPAKLTLGEDTAAASGAGYFYTWTAPADGNLTIAIDEECANWTYVINNMTAYAYGENHASDDVDEDGNPAAVYEETVYVSAGDVIDITFGTADWTEAEVPFTATFVKIGASADLPIFIMDYIMPLEIEAGETVYFAGRMGGKDLVIEGAEGLTVTLDGEDYTADESGVISFLVPGDGGFFAPPIAFSVTNGNDTAVSTTMSFQAPLGSSENPAELILGDESIDVPAAFGEYYYTWTAPADGEFYFQMLTETGWQYTLNNLTAGTYGDTVWSDSEWPETFVTLTVSKDDEIQLKVAAYDPETPWTTPAGTIEFNATFAKLGSVDLPIFLMEDTVDLNVEAGDTVYFMGRVDGKILNIENAEGLVLTLNGEDYTADENGVIGFQIPAGGGMMAPPTVFTVTNNGDGDVSTSIVFTYPVGHEMNPEELSLGESSVYMEEGAGEYFYTWTAPSVGKFYLEMRSEAGWQYTLNNLTAGTYGDTVWSDSEPAADIVWIDVSEGDEIQLKVANYDPEMWWATPAGEITFFADFEYPLGHEMNPASMKLGTTSTSIAKGDEDGYWYEWIAEDWGVLSFTMDAKKDWAYSIEVYDEDGNLLDDQLRSATSASGSKNAGVYVTAGDRVKIWVNTFNAKGGVNPKGTVKFTTSFYGTDGVYTSGSTVSLKFVHPVTGKTVDASKVNWEIMEIRTDNPYMEYFENNGQNMEEYRLEFDDYYGNIEEKYFSAYGSISKGKLKTYKNGDSVVMYVVASLKDDPTVWYDYYIELTPSASMLSASRVELDYYDEEEDNYYYNWYWIDGTQVLDLNGKTAEDDACLMFYAYTLPENANYEVNWKSSNTKVAKVVKEYVEDIGDVVKVYPVWNSKGGFKEGTATITGTAADGSGKKISIKVQMTKLPQYVEITHKDILEGEYEDGSTYKYMVVKPGQEIKLKAKVDPNASESQSKVSWWIDYTTSGTKISKGTVKISKNAFNGEYIWVEAYCPSTGVWDYVQLVVQRENNIKAVDILAPFWDWNGNMYWDDVPSGYVAGVKGYGIPCVTFRSFVRGENHPNEMADQNVTFSLDKDSKKIAELDTDWIVYWNSDEGEWSYARPDNFSDEELADMEWYPAVDVYAKEDGKGGYKTGTVKLTATAADGKTKKTISFKFINQVTDITITPKDGREVIVESYEDGYWDEDLGEWVSYDVEERAIYVTAGEKLTLKATVNSDASNKKIHWGVPPYYGSISSKGVLTVNKNIEYWGENPDYFYVYAWSDDGYGYEECIKVYVRPKATNVHARADFGDDIMRYVSNTTQTIDLTTINLRENEDGNKMMQLSALVYPFVADQNVKFSLDKAGKKLASVVADPVKDDEGNILYYEHWLILNGKTGTITVTATAQDGTGEKTSFKLKVISTIASMEMPEEVVTTGGKTVKLASKITYTPAAPSVKELSWSMKYIEDWTEDDEPIWSEPTNSLKGVASLNKSTGELKASKVKEPYTLWVTVTDNKTGNAAESYVTIFPKAVDSIVLKNNKNETIKKGSTVTVAEGHEYSFFFDSSNNGTCAKYAGTYYFTVTSSNEDAARVEYHEFENIDGSTYYGPGVIQTGAANQKVKITVKAQDGSGVSTYFYVQFAEEIPEIS